MSFNYWEECISEALEDAGIEASSGQIDIIVDWVEGAFENYGMFSGSDIATGNWHADYNDQIKKANAERDDIESKTQYEADKKLNRVIDNYEELVFKLRSEIERLRSEQRQTN